MANMEGTASNSHNGRLYFPATLASSVVTWLRSSQQNVRRNECAIVIPDAFESLNCIHALFPLQLIWMESTMENWRDK